MSREAEDYLESWRAINRAREEREAQEEAKPSSSAHSIQEALPGAGAWERLKLSPIRETGDLAQAIRHQGIGTDIEVQGNRVMYTDPEGTRREFDPASGGGLGEFGKDLLDAIPDAAQTIWGMMGTAAGAAGGIPGAIGGGMLADVGAEGLRSAYTSAMTGRTEGPTAEEALTEGGMIAATNVLPEVVAGGLRGTRGALRGAANQFKTAKEASEGALRRTADDILALGPQGRPSPVRQKVDLGQGPVDPATAKFNQQQAKAVQQANEQAEAAARRQFVETDAAAEAEFRAQKTAAKKAARRQEGFDEAEEAFYQAEKDKYTKATQSLHDDVVKARKAADQAKSDYKYDVFNKQGELDEAMQHRTMLKRETVPDKPWAKSRHEQALQEADDAIFRAKSELRQLKANKPDFDAPYKEAKERLASHRLKQKPTKQKPYKLDQPKPEKIKVSQQKPPKLPKPKQLKPTDQGPQILDPVIEKTTRSAEVVDELFAGQARRRGPKQFRSWIKDQGADLHQVHAGVWNKASKKAAGTISDRAAEGADAPIKGFLATLHEPVMRGWTVGDMMGTTLPQRHAKAFKNLIKSAEAAEERVTKLASASAEITSGFMQRGVNSLKAGLADMFQPAKTAELFSDLEAKKGFPLFKAYTRTLTKISLAPNAKALFSVPFKGAVLGAREE